MGLKKLYGELYEHFVRARDAHKGFDFQAEPLTSATPPSVSFTDRVTWRTLDRPGRLRRIKEERDRLQREILALKHPTTPS